MSHVISESSAPVAVVSYALPDGQRGEIALSPLPFVIGRAETANLIIPSGRISREHAVVSWEQDAFWIRDLGSTNGTFVGGRRIERQQLQGDELVELADVELRLQVLGSELDREQLVTRLRSWQELLLHQGTLLGLTPVVDLQSRQTTGGSLQFREYGLGGVAHWPDNALGCARVSEALHWLSAIRSVELGAKPDLTNLLFVAPAGWREHHQWLPILRARRGERQFAVSVESSWQAEQVEHYGLRIAWNIRPGDSVPEPIGDYWLLDESYASGVAHDETRWQALTEISDAARQCNAVSVISGLADEETAQICCELGCEWGRGPLFGGAPGTDTCVTGG